MRGTVKSVVVEEDRAGSYIKVGLLYDLANTAHTPIILWKREGRPEGSWPYAFTGLTIARTPNFSRGEVLDTYRGGPSVNRGPEWDDMRKALDRPYPPAGSTIVLSPSQTISFSYEVTIVCDRKRGGSAPGHPTLAELQQVGTLWLRVYHEVWSDNLEPSPRDGSALKFGRKLRRRWSPYGNLLLGDIYSEPIRVDLKAANYKLSAR